MQKPIRLTALKLHAVPSPLQAAQLFFIRDELTNIALTERPVTESKIAAVTARVFLVTAGLCEISHHEAPRRNHVQAKRSVGGRDRRA
jgi:hypothetical protein